MRLRYEDWKPLEYDLAADDHEEDRQAIDDLLQTAKTARDWLTICNLSKLIGDTPPISTSAENYRPFSHQWTAVRDDYDLGMPVGYGPNEISAIADLLDQEED